MEMEPLTVETVLLALRRQNPMIPVRIRNGGHLSNVGHVELVVAGPAFDLGRWHSEQVPTDDQRLVMITSVSLTTHQPMLAGELDAAICQLHEAGMVMHALPVVLELAPNVGSYFNMMCMRRQWVLEPTRL